MEHEHRVPKRSDINDAKCAAAFANPNFPNSGADGFHRLPVVRLKTTLNPLDLVSGRLRTLSGNNRITSSESPRNETGFTPSYINNDITRPWFPAKRLLGGPPECDALRRGKFENCRAAARRHRP